MSDICLQFGQCGNQIGFKFLDTVHKNEGEGKDKWFHTSGKEVSARCILVDTESKVIQGLLKDKRQWTYKPKNAVFQTGGSGNNWALGFSVNGPLLVDSVLERLRVESEESDFIRCLTCFLSAGGGTGSGLGTFITDKMRDLFPKKYVVSNLTIPFFSGASPVHLYNTVLSLSRLIDSSDAVIMFYNDFLFNQCSQLYKDNEFKFVEMNSIIAKQLCTLFHSYNGTCFIPHFLPNLVPIQSYNLISMKSFPYTRDVQTSHVFEPHIPWKSLIERLKSLLARNSDKFWDNQSVTKVFSDSKRKISSIEQPLLYYQAIGNAVMCRGKGSSNVTNFAKASFSSSSLYSNGIYEESKFSYFHDSTPIYGQQQFSCIATNSAIFNYKLDNIVEKAWNSFTKNAYFHHYEKYGLEERDFSIHFLKIEELIKKYKLL